MRSKILKPNSTKIKQKNLIQPFHELVPNNERGQPTSRILFSKSEAEHETPEAVIPKILEVAIEQELEIGKEPEDGEEGSVAALSEQKLEEDCK